MIRALLTCLAVLLLAGVTDAQAAKRGDCLPKRGKTTVLAKSKRSIAFQRTTRDRLGPVDIAYACLRRTGKRVRLGIDDTNLNEWIWDVTFAGPYVAHVRVQSEDLGSSASSVRVTDLRTGQVRKSPWFAATVRQLVLTPSGAAAWSTAANVGDDDEEDPAPAPPSSYRVAKLDGEGVQMLDCGAGVVLDSLVLDGPRLTWTSGGQTREWTLDRPLVEQQGPPPAC